MIQSPIENDYIVGNFDNGNGVVKAELRKKVILQVSFCELYIYILKKMLLGFPWHTIKQDFSVLVILLLD